MNKIAKVILLLLTLFPLMYFMWAGLQLPELMQQGTESDWFTTLFLVHLLVSVLLVGLIGFYLVHLYRNKRIHGNSKMLWTLALFIGSFITMPIYWWLHIWSVKERKLKPRPHKA